MARFWEFVGKEGSFFGWKRGYVCTEESRRIIKEFVGNEITALFKEIKDKKRLIILNLELWSLKENI